LEMSCPNRFWKTFKGYFHKNTKLEIPETVDSNELLTRYIFSDRHIRRQKKKATSAAFMPRDYDLRLSVFRIEGLFDKKIWEIGRKVGKKASRNLHARADIKALEVERQELSIEPDKNPPRHANIVRWPDERAKRLSIAQELAEVAILSII